jgi:type VI secretion system secreted protein VgrG
MQGVLDELSRLAIEHAEDEAAKPRLAELVGKLKRWHEGSNLSAGEGGQPIVAASAPAGILLASQDNVAVGAETKIDIVCAGDTEISAGRNLFMRAARGISMFAYELGLKLVAGRGNVVVQTHQGHVQIKSSGNISLIATDTIDLQARHVKVVAQGTQTDWENGTIVQQSANQIVAKSPSYLRVIGGAATPVGLDLPHTEVETDERIVVIDRQTGLPAKGRRYIARHEDGTTIEGVTDEEGRTSILQSYAFGDIEVRLLADGDDGDGGEAA